MAASSYDATTGAPEYDDADAPDVAVNPTEVAAFAASVGTRPMGTTAERTAYAFDREGLEWYDTTLDAVYLNDGTSWNRTFKRRTTFTPTWSNFTPSTSTVSAWYQIAGNICSGFVFVTLGGSWSLTGSGVTMNLPVTAANVIDGAPIGEGVYIDVGAGYYAGNILLNGSGAARLMHQPAAFFGDVKNSEPFTWVTGDSIRLQFRYEV